MAYTKLKVVNSVLKKGVHYMTSDYKTRNKKRPNHNGIDMIGKSYAKDWIVAIDKGQVTKAGYDAERGYYAEVKHENGYVSLYFHIAKDKLEVKKGDKLAKGDVIGYMGNTGESRGSHLHFGVKNDKGKYVDPKPYLMGEKSFELNEKKHYTGEYPKLPLRGYFYYKYDKKKKKYVIVDKGPEVVKLQKLLNWANDAKNKVDGYLGEDTSDEIGVYQNKYGLEEDFKFGKACLNKAKTIKK